MKGYESNFMMGSEWEWELDENGEVKKIKSIV